MKTMLNLVPVCLIVAVAFSIFGAQAADAGYGYGYGCHPTYHNYCYPSYVPTYYNPCHYSVPFYRGW